MNKTSVSFPIVYGSTAFPLKKVEEYNTHKWTLYIRGPNHEDLSSAIAKVIFHLHPSFAQPVREFTKPPYEVTERGWGEFDVTIRVFWRDDKEKPLVLTTPLKLYATPGVTDIKDGEPVIHETYDEIVFTDPSDTFFNQLMLGQESSSDANHSGFPKIFSNESAVQERLPLYSDEDDVKALLEAQKFLSIELSSVKDRIIKAQQAKDELDEALLAAATLKKGAPLGVSTTSTNRNTDTKIGTINSSNSVGGTVTGSATKGSNSNKPPSKRTKKVTAIVENGDN